MLRVIFLFFIFCLSLLANINSLTNSTVLILSNNSISTGVLVSEDGKILTSYHAIKNEKDIKVSFKEKDLNFYNAKILKKDITKDLVLIKITNKKALTNKTPIKLSNMDRLKLDDKVYTIAHPNQKLWTKSDGYIYQIIKDYHWKYKDDKEHKLSFVIQAVLPTNKGISGAGLIDNKNRLIALIAFDNPKKKDMVYAISIYDIKEFLLEIKQDYYKSGKLEKVVPLTKELKKLRK